MKITVQEKIAELERRIVALESAKSQPSVTRTTTTTTGPLTADQETHLSNMWSHFDAMFSALGKVFR